MSFASDRVPPWLCFVSIPKSKRLARLLYAVAAIINCKSSARSAGERLCDAHEPRRRPFEGESGLNRKLARALSSPRSGVGPAITHISIRLHWPSRAPWIVKDVSASSASRRACKTTGAQLSSAQAVIPLIGIITEFVFVVLGRACEWLRVTIGQATPRPRCSMHISLVLASTFLDYSEIPQS